jgi:hypothetical protein
MIAIAPSVSLEALDWGGRGAALVFLAGLGALRTPSIILRRNSPTAFTSSASRVADSAPPPAHHRRVSSTRSSPTSPLFSIR